MARPLRIEYPGALYHVMSRGNSYQAIFLDNKDRHAFLKYIEHCTKLHNLIFHAYGLMNNHFFCQPETYQKGQEKFVPSISPPHNGLVNQRKA